MSALAVRLVRCAVVLAALEAAHGQPPRRLTIDQLDHAVWTVRDGAPSYISSIAQTLDGVLWIGSAAGLSRFDGVRFEQFELPTPRAFTQRSVNEIAAMPDSSLWIGFSSGGVMVLTRGRPVNYSARDGIPEGRISGMVRDSTGDTWVSSVTGLARLHHGRWQQMGPAQQYPGGGAGNLYVDRRGTLWASMATGMYVFRHGESRFVLAASSDPKDGGFRTPHEAPDGSIWAASLVSGLTRLSDSSGRPTPHSSVKLVDRAVRSYVDRRGNGWITRFGSGLVRLPLPTEVDLSGSSRRRRTPTMVENVPLVTGLNANAMLEDPEGNMWVATGGGLERFRQTALTPVLLPQDVRWPGIAPASDGSIWLASYSHPVSLITDELRSEPNAPSNVTCVYRDLEGGLWFGGARGIWHIPPGSPPLHARYTTVALPPEGALGPIGAIARTPNGDLWMANAGTQTMRGVFRLRGGVWSRPPLPQRFVSSVPFTITADSAGRVWLGYANSVVRFDAESTHVFGDTTGIRVGLVTALHVRGRHLWIGGKTGLALLDDERVHPIVGEQAIREVTGIVETANGDVWLNGGDGVTHIPATELQRAMNEPAYRVRGEHFDEHDGLRGDPIHTLPRPTAIQGTDGRLWFTTSVGVAWIDPARITRNRNAPPVQVRALTAAGKTYDVAHRVSLPVGTTQLQVVYTAINLAKPNRVVFRYRLTGVDAAWVEAGPRREAFYTNLAPGSYRFRVIAANEDGAWNESGASIDFDIPPSFTQTKTFVGLIIAAIALALVAAGWLLAWWRQRQTTHVLRANFEGQLAERARVARELHDTLLGDMTGVALQLTAAAGRAPPGDENTAMAQLLSSLARQVQHSLVEARRSVSAIRTAPDSALPLHQQLDNAARRTFDGTGITARVEHSGSPLALSPTVESQIVGIATEAMANARRHAECRAVTIICSYEPREVCVRVRDDGRGFDASRATPTGHWGLVGMRERAASVGATLSIRSAPGAGTEVRIVAPGGPATNAMGQQGAASSTHLTTDRAATTLGK